MNQRSSTLARLMLIVALAALDLGILMNRAFGDNPFQAITVIRRLQSHDGRELAPIQSFARPNP